MDYTSRLKLDLVESWGTTYSGPNDNGSFRDIDLVKDNYVS